MSLAGRLRAALGRGDASALARARADLRMGLGLNPPGCLPPLNRAIVTLERLAPRPEVTVLLAQALRAKAEMVQGQAARDLRARAVAKLRAMLEARGVSGADRAAGQAALARAWMPLADDLRDPDLCLRQLMRAAEAQEHALTVPTAAGHLVMAEIALALGQHPLCPDRARWLALVHPHVQAVGAHAPDADQIQRAGEVSIAALQAESLLGPVQLSHG